MVFRTKSIYMSEKRKFNDTPRATKGGKGEGRAKGAKGGKGERGVCWAWLKGDCWRRDCTFKHTSGYPQAKGSERYNDNHGTPRQEEYRYPGRQPAGENPDRVDDQRRPGTGMLKMRGPRDRTRPTGRGGVDGNRYPSSNSDVYY
jgi:hypothetical protein